MTPERWEDDIGDRCKLLTVCSVCQGERSQQDSRCPLPVLCGELTLMDFTIVLFRLWPRGQPRGHSRRQALLREDTRGAKHCSGPAVSVSDRPGEPFCLLADTVEGACATLAGNREQACSRRRSQALFHCAFSIKYTTAVTLCQFSAEPSSDAEWNGVWRGRRGKESDE